MSELKEAIELLEKEKGISRESLLESIEQSLMQACKSNFGKNDNINVKIDPITCEYSVTAEKEVVATEADIVDPTLQVTVAEARKTDPDAEEGDIITVDINSKNFGRIATMNAKNVILQRIREEERNVVFNKYNQKVRQLVSGTVQRMQGKAYCINLGKADALLNENEQVKTEKFSPTERVKVYVLDVKSNSRGPKITVSRTHPELVKKLFEEEVTEIRDGVVEIKGISREPGSRTKMAVWSNNPDVDAVGACVGLNGSRVNAVVAELRGEKIDIIAWDENPAFLIENALSPAKVVSVKANAEEKSAKVIVPDNQLSLAIGKEGQNARLAARLTGFKIDIKSERQAREAGEAEEKSLEVSMPEETVHADDQKEAAENMSGLQEL
ncbi:MAG: transcription termination factor NusA [Lachnospiraceae bacterium]|jgi:N utilization substance protein A|nr:transcription termination factor NusA [Lachnospiraceae bacterium]MEE3377002.1 transcription termination factor NusA [Lachnospiraceae bacterium]MEE3437840.1 transcription termination factor NusA [Lachnospiraceae bacterium]